MPLDGRPRTTDGPQFPVVSSLLPHTLRWCNVCRSKQMGNFMNLAPAFIALLAAGGQVGLPILILTSMFSKGLKRHWTFVNLCFTEIIYSCAFCLLLYSGQYRLDQPNHALCVAQAAMVTGALPMVGVAAFTVVLRIWAAFQDPGSVIFTMFEKRFVLLILLLSPYVTFLCFLLVAILVATTLSDSVGASNGLYCFFKPTIIQQYMTPITCTVLVGMTAILAAGIAVQWYRRWHRVKQAFPLAPRKAQAIICFRACLFTAYTWFILFVSLYFQKKKSSVLYLAEAGLPLATFIVFGTQRDMLEAWGILKGAPSRSPRTAAGWRPFNTSTISSASGESAPSFH